MASPLPPQDLRWLYVDLNSYFASVEQQLQPEWRGRPLIVLPVMTEYTCAIAASYEAKALGIKTNTSVRDARHLCPEIICAPARHDAYVEYHHRIIEEVERHIPVSAVLSIDEVACQLMDNECQPEEALRIAQAIKQGIRQRVGDALTCSVGIASNRYLAKVASDMQKPDGLTLLSPDDIPTRLLALPLQDFPGIGRNMARRLYAAGVFTTPQLYQLSPKQMRCIWHSVAGERLWYHLRGYRLDEPATEKRTVGHSHVLPPELRPAPEARHVARRLTAKAASRLRRFGYYCSAYSLSIRLESGHRFATERRFRRVQDTPALLAIAESAWQELMSPLHPHHRLKKVSVLLHGLVPAQSLQPELLDSLHLGEQQARERAEKLSHAMDALNQKYGRDTILMGTLPAQGKSFSGTRIAFTRIPDREEFSE